MPCHTKAQLARAVSIVRFHEQPSVSSEKSVLLHVQAELRAQKARSAVLYSSLRIQHRQYQCTLHRLQSLDRKFKKLKHTELLETDNIATNAIQLLDYVIAENAELEAQLVQATQKLAEAKEINASMHKESVAALKSGHKEQLRALCARNLCAAARVPVKGKISGRTAARAVLEGGIAAKIQIGHDLGQAKTSGDGTSNKHIPYDAHFVHIKTPGYSDPSGPAHRSRFLDQTAEAEAEEVIGQIDESIRSGHFERSVVIISKLKGIITDHCSRARLWSEIMHGRTNDAQNQLLGEEQTLELSEADIDAAFELSWAKMIQKAGGQAAWSCLPKAEQNLLQAIATKAALISMGEARYQNLSDDEQRSLDFFIWVGCGCHKDLNSVSGGYAAMLAWFLDHDDVLSPALLPHKSNAGVIACIRDPHRLNDDQQDAVQTSASGAVRAAWIAGALFNNKDDKKGQQDTFNWWFEKELDLHLSFPDTSNTRYGSYCAACAVLLQYRLQFIRFLEFIKLSKKSTTWTNIKSNLLIALTDPPTLSEMAVMALYAQVISHPYIRAVRGPAAKDINMLNLGPLHHKIEAHMESIIANPQLVLEPDADYHTAAADGLEWDNPQVVEIILADTSLFPHLEDLLVAFFRGSLQAWCRFTTEFTPGGLIDEATEIEKDLAWLPPTNDLNEGILGSFRQFMCFNPSTTLLMFNSRTMFERNNTQTFIDAKFDTEDHRLVMKIAQTKGTVH
ncbi:hypothetical protein FIBSPDRAFT_900103 [Athelia psychrophila]|uniref:Uncharacterized protein n=1 Tax=Athelia psychrophila TaxID=1759441 RepID=A0A165YVN2_9AGAM|nr:hypothetical protein FIBSPDRAFT_900103 [Fibularhizoctonia sp. CBS 109695]